LYRKEPAGILTQQDDGSYVFCYLDSWAADSSKPSIALTLPKSKRIFHAPHLFPFFYHLLPEGINRQVACQRLRIDLDDDFSLLSALALTDTIGAVTVQMCPDKADNEG
jgi:serine/threonine-protein kinase HipA